MASFLKAPASPGLDLAAGPLFDAAARAIIMILLAAGLMAFLAAYWTPKASKAGTTASSTLPLQLPQQSSSSRPSKKQTKKGKKGRKVPQANRKFAVVSAVAAQAYDEEIAEEEYDQLYEQEELQEAIALSISLQEEEQRWNQVGKTGEDTSIPDFKDTDTTETEVSVDAVDASDVNTKCSCAKASLWGCESTCMYSNGLLMMHRNIYINALKGPPGLERAAGVSAPENPMANLRAVSISA